MGKKEVEVIFFDLNDIVSVVKLENIEGLPCFLEKDNEEKDVCFAVICGKAGDLKVQEVAEEIGEDNEHYPDIDSFGMILEEKAYIILYVDICGLSKTEKEEQKEILKKAVKAFSKKLSIEISKEKEN